MQKIEEWVAITMGSYIVPSKFFIGTLMEHSPEIRVTEQTQLNHPTKCSARVKSPCR